MKTPVYQIIENDFKEKIKNGTLSQGDMIPGDNELKELYGVSRMTVRQALNNLVNEGYLYRHKGRGTYVNKIKIDKKIQGLQSFTEEMEKLGRKVSNKLVAFKTMTADDEIAGKLFIGTNEEVILIERVRCGDVIPVLYEKLYVPRKMFKNLDASAISGSFYKYVEQTVNLTIDYSIQVIEAMAATGEVAKLLEIPVNEPVLHITLNSFLDNGQPFEYVKSYYRADQYRFIQHAIR